MSEPNRWPSGRTEGDATSFSIPATAPAALRMPIWGPSWVMTGRARPNVADAVASLERQLEGNRRQLAALLERPAAEVNAEVLAMTAGSVVAALEAMREVLGVTASAADVIGDEQRSERPPLIDVESEHVGSLVRLRLRGRLDRNAVPIFASTFTASVARTPAAIEVDCSELVEIDVEGARVLAYARLGLGERYPFKVVVREGSMRTVLSLAGLDPGVVHVLDAPRTLVAGPGVEVETGKVQ